MDFFRRNPMPESSELERDDWLEKEESSPDLLRICSALLSRKDLNSLGASSGWRRAGTQNNLDESSSLSDDDGAMPGIPAGLREGRSGSPAAATSMDILLRACKLLNSWATAAGLDS
jgi:hypothetical protein